MDDLVSFIIPAYNNEGTIGECLGSILRQPCEKEVIVVDNGSIDSTRKVISRFPVKLLIEKRRGSGAARNRGLSIARGKYIAFVDADAKLPKNWCTKAKRALDRAPSDVAGCGGPLLSIGKSAVGRSLDALTFGKPINVGRTYTDALNASGVMFKTNVLKEIRFDEEFIRGQDTEIGFRIRGRGFRLLYDRDLYVYHHNPTTVKGLLRKWLIYGKSYPLSYLKHKRMRGTGFYGRLFFIPLFSLLIALSLIWNGTLILAGLQIALLFLSYAYIGSKIPSKLRGIDVISFSLVHTTKQLAQVTGIWIGTFQRIFTRIHG